MGLDYPLCRDSMSCPVCGGEKSLRLVMCWPCWRSGGKEGAHDKALEAFEQRRKGPFTKDQCLAMREKAMAEATAQAECMFPDRGTRFACWVADEAEQKYREMMGLSQ